VPGSVHIVDRVALGMVSVSFHHGCPCSYVTWEMLVAAVDIVTSHPREQAESNRDPIEQVWYRTSVIWTLVILCGNVNAIQYLGQSLPNCGARPLGVGAVCPFGGRELFV
jgi:hypothetical protein